MTLKKIGVSLAAAGLLLAGGAMPAMAETSVLVGSNGAGSVNTVKVKMGCVSAVIQGNETSAMTEVTSEASTGGNSASMNTGSGVTLVSGAATSNVTVDISGGNNTATTDGCCECAGGPVDVAVVDNGVWSHNKVVVKKPVLDLKVQGTRTTALTGVWSKAKSGWNKADKNTGGTVGVLTGPADSTVEVTVEGGSNTINP